MPAESWTRWSRKIPSSQQQTRPPAWRYGKAELAMESPRLWSWQNRLKLLLIVALAYAFLLTLLDPLLDDVRQWLLRHWCH